MNRAILSQRITSILADLNRLTNALYAMNTTDIQRYPDNYEVLSTDAALRAENIACRLRHLIYSTTSIKKGEYLLDPFTAAMGQYTRDHPMPRFQHCVICFSHVYCQDLPERRVRDYDNLELKRFLDVAASFILTDDSGLLCDAYNTTELGETDCTRISIMDSKYFPTWLAERQAALQSITDL